MMFFIKKLSFSAVLNSSLFLVLIIGIQNSSKKSKINLILTESISLPISFIIGSSFISGSLAGSFVSLSSSKEKKFSI